MKGISNTSPTSKGNDFTEIKDGIQTIQIKKHTCSPGGPGGPGGP